MRSRTPDFLFYPNFNFGVDSVFVAQHYEQGMPFPPTESYIIAEGAGSNNVITEDGNYTVTE